tara:strand:- start:1744 stop:1986 length:243 start_codon:yes stop_codon:yes gene_type:complete
MINDNTMHIKPKDIFDSCIVGYHLVYQSWLYDYELLIDGFIQLGLTYEEAMDHVSYNIIGNQYKKFFPIVHDMLDMLNDE